MKKLIKMIIVIFGLFIAAAFVFSLIGSESESDEPPINKIIDKTIKSHHVKVESTDQGLASITITVTALTNIDYIDVNVEFLDRDGNLIKASTKRVTNLSSGLSQSVKFNLDFFEALKATNYTYTYKGKIK